MPKSSSPLPWMGSKRRVAQQILERMPEHTCYVELFAGSAAVLFARDEPAKVEVINDLDGELVNLFRVLKHHLVEFVQQFRWGITSRQMWRWLDDTPPETLTDIQRAARFYYLHRLGFGGKSVGRTFGYSPTSPPRINFLRIEEALSDVHQRLAHVLVEQKPWQDCLRRYDRPTTFFFADPPYLGLQEVGDLRLRRAGRGTGRHPGKGPPHRQRPPRGPPHLRPLRVRPPPAALHGGWIEEGGEGIDGAAVQDVGGRQAVKVLSRDRARQLLGAPGATLDDRQVDEVREQAAAFARILVDVYQHERREAAAQREVAQG